jgi:hypothetical protein
MIDGMSRKEYFEFLKDVEESMYDPEEFKPWEDEMISPYESDGLLFTAYKGSRRKSYSQPMFDLKKEHPTQYRDGCHRCGTNPYRSSFLWDRREDEAISVRFYTVFTGNTNRLGEPEKDFKEIHFIPYFAARRPHP